MFGGSLAEWGVPIEEAQILMRHASASSTSVYYPISEKRVRQRLSRVEMESQMAEPTPNTYVWMQKPID
jgi:site-specific recombinase XerD